MFENKIKNILSLNQLKDMSSEIKSCFEQKQLNPKEYDYLLESKKQQLKIILDLNLLPNYEFISRSLKKQFYSRLTKADPGEILLEEFQIIEQELINLNLARVEYIQENY